LLVLHLDLLLAALDGVAMALLVLLLALDDLLERLNFVGEVRSLVLEVLLGFVDLIPHD
jgi:hypothetical protein